jgi:predicted acetyltransferase
MRKYRRKGVGKAAALAVFEQFRGKWEVHELQRNGPSRDFWRKVIAEYTGGEYTVVQWNRGAATGPIQCFDNSASESRSKTF